MSKFVLSTRQAVRLQRLSQADDQLFCTLKISSGTLLTNIFLPNIANIRYVILPKNKTNILVQSSEFGTEQLGRFASIIARIRAAMIFKRKNILIFDNFQIFAVGPKLSRKIFLATVRRMSKSGAALDGPIIQKYPELLIGWKNLHDNSLPVAKISNVSSKIAIVVHIYYTETWAEIATILRRIDYEFDLIVTVSSSDKSVVAAIYRDFTNADVEIIENRGRDVRPFLVLLERGRFDRYRYVCKIHGKKSDDGGRMANLGAIWRNRMFFDLLAAPNALDSILNVFDRDPNIGMLGSAAYRYPSQLCSVALSWGKNRPLVLDIAEKMGIGADQFALDFFCGTMFWVRPETLRPLRELRLAGNFPDEMGKLDGGLEHAIERLFSAAVVASGFRIEGVDCVRLL